MLFSLTWKYNFHIGDPADVCLVANRGQYPQIDSQFQTMRNSSHDTPLSFLTVISESTSGL